METKNFKTSTIVENFKNTLEQHVQDYMDLLGETQSEIESDSKSNNQKFVEINKNALSKALSTICNLWNKDEKSRNFVKHLIGAFYRIPPYNKVMQFSENDLTQKNNKCALTSYWLCGIKDIANLGSNMLIHRAKHDVAYYEYNENHTEENKKKLDAAIENYHNELKKYPVAVRNRQFAYFSEKSNKFLSNEGAIAINLFTTEMIMFNEHDVIFTLNKRRISQFNKHNIKNNKLSKAEVNKVAKANTYNVFDEKTLNKLLKVKEELDSNKNKNSKKDGK